MKLEKFNELASQTRMQSRSKEGARLVLVEGLSITEAAKQMGFSQQRVSYLVKRLKDLDRECPEGYEQVTVCVAPGNGQKVRDFAETLKK